MATAKTKAQPKTKTAAAAPSGKPQQWDSRKLPAVTPHLVCENAAKAIDFYTKAFGAEEIMRLPGPDGRLWHASVRIFGAPVMLVDEMPEMGSLGPKALKGTTVTVHLNVPDVDAVFERAVKAGATAKMPPADMFWGDRYGVIEDPFGHKWSIATHIKAMTVDEIKAAVPKHG